MGKPEDDGNSLRAGGEALGDSAERRRNAPPRRRLRCCCGCFEWISGLVGCKCLFVLLLSVSLFLSALFLLLPFGAVDRGGSSLDPRFKGYSFFSSSFVLIKVSCFGIESTLDRASLVFTLCVMKLVIFN